MSEETHIGVPAAVPNNPLTKVIFRPIYRSKETYLRSKETYLYVRRNLDRRIGSSAQQSVDKSADALFLFIGQKRPIYMSKETYIGVPAAVPNNPLTRVMMPNCTSASSNGISNSWCIHHTYVYIYIYDI